MKTFSEVFPMLRNIKKCQMKESLEESGYLLCLVGGYIAIFRVYQDLVNNNNNNNNYYYYYYYLLLFMIMIITMCSCILRKLLC